MKKIIFQLIGVFFFICWTNGHATLAWCEAGAGNDKNLVKTEVFDIGAHENYTEVLNLWTQHAKTLGKFTYINCFSNDPKFNISDQEFINTHQKQIFNIRSHQQKEPGVTFQISNWKHSVQKNTTPTVPNNALMDRPQAKRNPKTRNADLHCIQAANTEDGAISLKNICKNPVTIGYCYSKAARGTNEERYLCKPTSSPWAKEGVTYITQDPGAIKPGQGMIIGRGNSTEDQRVIWVACESPYIFPVISGITADKNSGTGYCIDPT